MALIKTDNLVYKTNGLHILKNINLEVARGEVFALIGPTGAGKTTLLRLLDLLETPSSGKVYYDGLDVTMTAHRLDIRRQMAFVQQKPVVFNMSVFDNIACGLRWRNEKDNTVKQKAEAVLELVGMAGYGKRNARMLSGGETQRVAIARALVIEPELLLLDEPTANLDPVSALKIEDVLVHILKQKSTMLIATHDMAQGQRLADRIGVLNSGELIQVGKASDIFTLPGSKEVAELIGIDNILAGIIAEKDNQLVTVKIEGNGNNIQAISDFDTGEPVYALIRPEDVTLTLTKNPSSARNSFTGRITRITPHGPLVRVGIDCGFLLLALITKRSAEEFGFGPGDMVHTSFKATAVRIIKRWR